MNDQEAFWAGKFGDDYTDRCTREERIDANIDFFSHMLVHAPGIESVMEFGCNSGLNLAALEYYNPTLELNGIDINANALEMLRCVFKDKDLPLPNVGHCSLNHFESSNTYDLTFTKGVLIHLDPAQLDMAYDKLYKYSNKYILIAEYYNPDPVELTYRGHSGKLFKRDFAGEIMSRYPLKLIDYRFFYHGDRFPQDDIVAFLFEKV